MDRSKLCSTFNKCIAYIQCNKRELAKQYLIELVNQLGFSEVLK